MRRRLPRYFLLSFFSFVVFSILFQAMANAQDTTIQTQLESPIATPSVQFIPTPTIYTQSSSTTLKTVNTNVPLPSPTPTIYILPPQLTSTPTPTEAPQITVIPTISPTAIPTPTTTPTNGSGPTATAPTQGTTDLESLFSQYSSQYSVSEDELKKIAQCESGANTLSVSGDGTYTGMFQFSASTWASVRGLMGLDPNPDLRENAGEAIHTTAFMLSRGEESAWPNCH
jgi:hypothetical protein